MIAALLTALPLLAAPEGPVLPVPAGRAIVLDGELEAQEWADAFSVSREVGGGKTLTLHLKRQGGWLALGLSCDRTYRGEVMRLYVSDKEGAWLTALFFGIGQPALPPLLWRRASPEQLKTAPIVAECPRACRARVRVEAEGRWSAEYLVRMGALGIGRDDRRVFGAHLSVEAPGEEGPVRLLALPEGSGPGDDPGTHARLRSEDGWGRTERWEPVPPEVSREFDDHELLYRLYLEHDRISLREAPEFLVIASATRPRQLSKIEALRAQLEAGRVRNPTLPAWQYFLGRLLHEGNLYAEARAIVEAIPKPLRDLDPFVNLIAEHYVDTGEYQPALDVCAAHPRARGMAETLRMALVLRRWSQEEEAARKRDAQKAERNPVVRLVTEKGDIVCELFEDDAPAAVTNFMDLVLERKYYDGLRFHSVVGGILAQIGNPQTRRGSTATGDGPDWRLPRDPSRRRPLRGYLTTVPVTGGVFHGSQFIIALAPLLRDAEQLVTFGRILEGREVAESLEVGDTLRRVEVVRKRNHGYDALPYRVR